MAVFIVIFISMFGFSNKPKAKTGEQGQGKQDEPRPPQDH